MLDSSCEFQPLPVSAVLRARAEAAQLWGAKFNVEPVAGATLDLAGGWSDLHERWRGSTRDRLWNHPVALAFVSFFQSVGVSASRKQPPSAVNLVQRFCLGQAPQSPRSIHPLVDAGNLASAESLIPVAVLDAAGINGMPCLDLSQAGDSFLGFGMAERAQLRPGTPVLRDCQSILSVFCYRDSPATAVTSGTRQIWLLACAVADIDCAQVKTALHRSVQLMSSTHVLRASE